MGIQNYSIDNRKLKTAAKIYSTIRVGKKEGRVIRGADKEAGNEQRGQKPTRGGWETPPLRATSRAHGAIRLSTSHPEQINPPHSKLRATWGSLGQLHPIATPLRPQTRPDPDQRPIEDWEGRRPSLTLTLVDNPTSGWAQASFACALSRSPPSGSSRMPPLRLPQAPPRPRSQIEAPALARPSRPRTQL